MPQIIDEELGTAYHAAILRGELQSAVARLEDVSRLGADGHAYRVEPAKGEPFPLALTFTTDADGLAALRQSLRLLQGRNVSYVDHLGQTFESLACLAARLVRQHRAALISGAVDAATGDPGTGHTHILVMEFLLQAHKAL